MQQPVWNTEWTLNAPCSDAPAPFPLCGRRDVWLQSLHQAASAGVKTGVRFLSSSLDDASSSHRHDVLGGNDADLVEEGHKLPPGVSNVRRTPITL